MDQLLPIINSIRDALASVQLEFTVDLPRLAVVGGQSAGKSSVLEALVGRSFLPTGDRIVTRRPLELRLVNTSASKEATGDQEWGEFQHLPDRRFENFDEIREEIVKETERLCGSKQRVERTPIVLKISSPRVLDLALIDLPGIARVPVGDQPEDIEQQIRHLALDYVSCPSCMILAVVAGNVDLATSDALAIAREVDPDGARTIGVVTKLDLAEHGSDVLPILEGQLYPLSHGFVGVVCRSPSDVQAGTDLREHASVENKYFSQHPAYQRLADRCGIGYLAKHLNRILMEHVRDALPAIKDQEVVYLIRDCEAELQGYGESIKPAEQGQLMLGLFTHFSNRFGDVIEGKLNEQQDIPPGQLAGRARIDFIFRDVFARTLRNFDSCDGVSDDEIRVAIRNAVGPRASLLIPEAAFEHLARKQIRKLLAPSLQCVELVFGELQRVLLMSELPEFRRFARFRSRVFGVVRDILRKSLEPTNQMIKQLVDIELSYINTNHPDFIGVGGAMQSAAASTRCDPTGPDLTSSDVPPNVQVLGLQATGSSAYSPALALSPPAATGGTAETSPATVTPPADVAAIGNVGGFFSSLSIFRPRFATSPSVSNEMASRISPLRGGRDTTRVMRSPQPVTATPFQGAFTAGDVTNAPHQSMRASFSNTRLTPVPQVINPAAEPATQRDRVDIALFRKMLESYLSLVKKNVADSVPKVVMAFMVNSLKDDIQSECVARLYKPELFEELLEEGSDIQRRRVGCRERLQALYHVIEVTEQVSASADNW